MSKPISECCPNCSQPFAVSCSQAKTACRIPLFLTCGHNVCEPCVSSFVKFTEPIDCRVCNSSMEVNRDIIQNNGLHHVFPINYYLYGKLAVQNKEPESDKVEDPFINLKALLNSLGNNKGQCHECKVQTTKMCKECKTILCESCFKKSHSFGFTKHHVLSDIEQLSDSNTCPIHKKDLEYYCQDCKKVICIDCFFFGGDNSCKNHNVIPIQEASKGVVEEINEFGPKIDETYRRLTKTAVDIGHMLKGSMSVTSQNEYSKIKTQVQQNFSKMYAVIQNHEQDILKTLDKIEFTAKESLLEAKKQVAEGIKKTQTVLSKINVVTKNQDAKINLLTLLEDAKSAANYPWYLSKDEFNEQIQLKVNEDILPKLNSYVDLEGNPKCTFKLRATNELGENFDLPAAPQNPVFPPALLKDIRELNKPRKYVGESHQEANQATSDRHHKNRYGSNSSLNSLGSSGSIKKNLYGDQFRKPIIQAVSPCLASNDNIPKPLIPGSKEMVYISHIVNPHQFYVQRVTQQAVIKRMMREFRNAASAPTPTQAHATESRVYLVLNTTWKEWQRCKITHIDRRYPNNLLYHVFCFDFGNTEIVTIDQLRLIAPNWMMSPPPLAIHCSLANCKPVGNAWSTEDSLLMQEIIDNNQAVMYVRHVKNDGVAFMMTVECDIITYQDGVHIACALQFHCRALIIDHKLHLPPIECRQEKPKIFINNNDFKRGSTEEVNITHVESPDKFYVRKVHLEDTYKNLCSQLNETYIITLKEGRIFYPEIGMSCVAQCEEEGGWVRGLVTGTPGSRRVSVFAPDSGRTHILNWTALRHIAHHFTSLKALATECHLSGITPPNKRWGPGSVRLLNSLKGRRIEAHVEEEARGRSSCVGVTLYDITDDEPLCVNTEMVKLNLAITIGVFRFNKTQVVEEEQYLSRTPLDKSTKPVRNPNKGAVTILKKKEQDDTDSTTCKNNKTLDAKDKGPYKVEVKFLSVQSPSLIYIAVLDKQSSYKEYFEKIQELYHKKEVPVKENLAIGDKCCAFYNKTNTWRRAVILELLEDGDNVKIFYSDFGCVDVVPKTSIKEFHPELATVSDAAIKCHMSGIMPAIGEEWPSLTKEFLVELVDAYSRHYITRKGAIKDNSLPIEIWVYHIIQGDALEPNRAEWRCLNSKIIEQGLAIPDKTTMPVTKNKQDLDNETISFLNLSGNVKDLLELEPLSNEALECATARYELELKAEEPSCVRESTPPPEDDTESTTNYVCDWLPPKPFTVAKFLAIPTYVDNDGNLYLYEKSEQPTLDLIRKALDIGFVGSKGHYDKWVVGQLCIARFYLDGLYYRGRIVEVHKVEKYCIVNYVDYGNDEKCMFSDIINSIVLHQIPIQSHKCILGRVEPKNNKWSRTTLDYVHKLVVDNECEINVIGETRDDGSVPIELKCNGLLLSDLLVDLDFARYTDGTQAIVTKYVKPANRKQQQVAHKPEDPKPDSDSEPDYLVEEEPSTLRDSSFDTSDMYIDMQNKDWNQLLEEEEGQDITFKVYPEHDLKEFICFVAYVKKTNVELSIEFENNIEKEKYDKLTEEVSVHGGAQPPLNGVFANKACLALFSADNLWYRAEILSYCEATSRVRVRFVDYGNKEVVNLSDVREIPDEWVQLPSRTMSATLHGVRFNEQCDQKQVAEEYVKTFTEPEGIFATVECLGENTRFVILKDGEGKLIYENLIQKGFLILLENATNEN